MINLENKMKNKIFIYTIFAVLVLCGCSEQDDMQGVNNGTKTVPVVISASIEETLSTKTVYDDSNPDKFIVKWNNNDKIGVFSTNNVTSNAQFSINKLSGDYKTANFVGNIDIADPNKAITIYGYYPYAASETNKNAVSIDLSFQEQKGGGTVIGDYDFMAAIPITYNKAADMNTSDIQLSFIPLLTIMSFEITNSTEEEMQVRSIRLEAVGDEKPFYTSGKVDICDSAFPITYAEDGSTDGITLTMSGNSPIPSGGKERFNMVMFPVTEKLPAQFKVIIDTGTRTYIQIKTTPQKGFERGKRYIMEVDQLIEEKTDEFAALCEFYKATNGEQWRNNTNWGSDKPLDQWYGVTCVDGCVSSIYLSNNNLTGHLPDGLEQLTRLEFLMLGNNNIKGNIPESLAKLKKLKQVELFQNKMSGEIPQVIQQYPLFGLWDAKYAILPQQNGYGLTISNSEIPDPLDGLVYTYIKSSKPNEVSIIMMGDGFIASDMGRNGKYETYLSEIADHILSVEPFKSYRDYFTIYFVNAVSKEEGISNNRYTKNTVFSTFVGLENSAGMNINQRLCYEYADKTGIKGDNGAILMIANTTEIGGSSGGRWRNGGFAGISLSVGYKDVALHELGHAFARLHDEYIIATDQTFTGSSLDVEHNVGMSLNVDDTNDPKEVIWKHFIGHVKYPMVGLYEGALWGKGIWRPEQISCMGDNRPYFNAPSREAIVKRIKKIAQEQYSWDEFVLKDKYEPYIK